MSATATVKGGFWPEQGINTLTQINGRAPARRRIAQLFNTRGLMALREVAETLNGAAAGGAALKTVARIAASSELGGKRTIENETLVNRVTVAGDVTEINADILSLTSYDSTPVANGDGNPLGTR